MSSNAQTLANQANAQLSSGPKTPEGKATSSRNATKHGFRGRLHVRDHEREEFEALVEAHRAELNPQGPLENLIFDKLITAAWHLFRLEWAETELLKNGDKESFVYGHPEAYAILDTMYRYRQSHERSLYRALKELRALQTERAIRQRVGPELTQDLPAAADSAEVTKRTQFFSSQSALRGLERSTHDEAVRMLHDIRRRVPVPVTPTS